MKKISILLPNLVGGGTERLAIYLANDWLKKGYRVEFVLLNKHGALVDKVDSKIAIVDLKCKRIRNLTFRFSNYLRKNKPDIIWSGMWPLTSMSIISWIISGRIGKIYLIDHNQLDFSVIKTLGISKIYVKFIMRITYPLASGVMAVSEGVKENLNKLGNFKSNYVKVIHNPVSKGIYLKNEYKLNRKDLWGKNFNYNILSVGSLTKQKNHELLIRAFAEIDRSLKPKLIILGEGPLRKNLENLINELNLNESVLLLGFVTDPYPWYLTADLFVLSSDWEGLPTVLIEALDCGLQIVSTDCKSGPAEILKNGKFGQLVPLGDKLKLKNSIEHSLLRPYNKMDLVNRAKDFNIENISALYLKYFDILIRK